jgi:signal transduction histidine kinase
MLDRLEQGFKAQQQFIGNASHELRTPLTILRSEAEWALSKARTNDEYRQVIEKVQQKSNYLSNLINRLLILARINGPATAKDLQPVRLDEILLHTAEQLKQETADAQPVQITIDTAATAEYTLRGDASMLHTAVANLLENALKYGLGHKVEVTLTQPLPWHQIAILDYGIGISPEESALVFDPFYRSKTARNMAAGTGLGLTLVKAIAQWHGGSIELAPHPYGTLFVLKLPCPTDQVWSRL